MWMSWPAWVILAPIHSTLLKQMVSKYCKSPNVDLPEPYLVDVPVLVRSNADCAYFVQKKKIAIFLPHDWFSWMTESKHELVSGLASLDTFWEEHDLLDPKLEESPITSDDWSKYVPMVFAWGWWCLSKEWYHQCSIHEVIAQCSQCWIITTFDLCHSKRVHTQNQQPGGRHNAPSMESLAVEVSATCSLVSTLRRTTLAWNGIQRAGGLQKLVCNLSESALHGWLFAITGDGEYFQNEFKLKGHSFNDCCFNCSAKQVYNSS